MQTSNCFIVCSQSYNYLLIHQQQQWMQCSNNKGERATLQSSATFWWDFYYIFQRQDKKIWDLFHCLVNERLCFKLYIFFHHIFFVRFEMTSLTFDNKLHRDDFPHTSNLASRNCQNNHNHHSSRTHATHARHQIEVSQRFKMCEKLCKWTTEIETESAPLRQSRVPPPCDCLLFDRLHSDYSRSPKCGNHSFMLTSSRVFAIVFISPRLRKYNAKNII